MATRYKVGRETMVHGRVDERNGRLALYLLEPVTLATKFLDYL